MQIDVEIQEEKIKKEVLSKLKSVRKIQWKEKKSDHELECNLKKKFGLNQIISKLLVSRESMPKALKNFLILSSKILCQIHS